LLRVIQEGQYKRVGGNTWFKTDFRLVCATNRDLSREVTDGRFRADLYYRLAGAVFRVPSLAQRREDAIPLAQAFLSAAQTEASTFDDAVNEYLLARDYPGNVRDLKQLVFRMSLRHAGPGPITVGDIPEDDRPVQAAPPAWLDGDLDLSIRRALLSGAGLKEIGKVTSDIAIRIALEEAGGNLQQAARRLQVTDRALQMRRAAGRQENHRPGSSKSA
jgi:DNA-binding NtrC family response regulator